MLARMVRKKIRRSEGNEQPSVYCIMNKEDYKQFLDYLEYAAFTRGIFIQETIQLERCIDEYICRHFCKDDDRKSELLECVMATKRITFDSKLDVARFIIEKHNKEFAILNPQYHKEIRSLIEHRNIFAHYLLDTSEGVMKEIKSKKDIVFIKFDREHKLIKYTEKELFLLFAMLQKYGEEFATLIQ